ncbi:hypothetical protein, partial [Consotaella aegiceratis]|uniref:hypothetical protein n=1 Tax=Consotaella aegiceratis TaxID=3097961 RepID=UPI002F400D74
GFRAKGDQVFQNVTVRNADGEIVSYADMIVVREGKVRYVVEAKSGRANLSRGQANFQEMVRTNEPFNFTGKNAVGIPGANELQTWPNVQYRQIGPTDPVP